jgi:hypothetical protein
VGQAALFAEKVAWLRAVFADAAAPEVLAAMQLVASPPAHARHRAQFAVRLGVDGKVSLTPPCIFCMEKH